MYIVSMILGLLLVISIVGIYYYELLNDHFETIYEGKLYEYKHTKLEDVKETDGERMEKISHI